MEWTPSQGQFFLWVKVYFCLFFIVLFTLPSWQLLFPAVLFSTHLESPFYWNNQLKWTPSQGQFFSWVKVYFSLFFIVSFTLPSWQLLFPNKSLQAFFLPEIDVVSQNCKTQNTPLTLRVIPEQSWLNSSFDAPIVPLLLFIVVILSKNSGTTFDNIEEVSMLENGRMVKYGTEHITTKEETSYLSG